MLIGPLNYKQTKNSIRKDPMAYACSEYMHNGPVYPDSLIRVFPVCQFILKYLFKQRSLLDCANVQADLGTCCLLMQQQVPRSASSFSHYKGPFTYHFIFRL